MYRPTLRPPASGIVAREPVGALSARDRLASRVVVRDRSAGVGGWLADDIAACVVDRACRVDAAPGICGMLTKMVETSVQCEQDLGHSVTLACLKHAPPMRLAGMWHHRTSCRRISGAPLPVRDPDISRQAIPTPPRPAVRNSSATAQRANLVAPLASVQVEARLVECAFLIRFDVVVPDAAMNPDEEGAYYQPRLYLYGSKGRDDWRAELSLIDFARRGAVAFKWLAY